jgi:2-oxoisovalerate dehydrogenase E1 component
MAPAEGPDWGGQPGAGRSLRSGANATVLAAGGALTLALEAAEALAAEGVEVDVLDPGNLRAPALSLLAGRVNETGHVVYVGLAAQVAESVNAAAFLRLESPPQVCAPEGIASAVRAALAY